MATRTKKKAGADELARRRAVDSELEDGGEGFRYRLAHAIYSRQLQDHDRLSYTRLSEEVKIHPQSVTRYLAGHKRPSMEVGSRLARRLGCSAGWLFFGGKAGRPGSVSIAELDTAPPRETFGETIRPRRKRGK